MGDTAGSLDAMAAAPAHHRVLLASEIKAAAWTAVGLGRPHESATLHVLGQANYTDDIPEVRGTLHGALGLSSKPHARIVGIDLSPVQASRGVVAVFTAVSARALPATAWPALVVVSVCVGRPLVPVKVKAPTARSLILRAVTTGRGVLVMVQVYCVLAATAMVQSGPVPLGV